MCEKSYIFGRIGKIIYRRLRKNLGEGEDIIKILFHIIGFVLLFIILQLATEGIILNTPAHMAFGYNPRVLDTFAALMALIGLIPAVIAWKKGRN